MAVQKFHAVRMLLVPAWGALIAPAIATFYEICKQPHAAISDIALSRDALTFVGLMLSLSDFFFVWYCRSIVISCNGIAITRLFWTTTLRWSEIVRLEHSRDRHILILIGHSRTISIDDSYVHYSDLYDHVLSRCREVGADCVEVSPR